LKKGVFGERVSSVGEFQQKSYLLSHALDCLYDSPEKGHALTDKVIRLLIDPMKDAGLNVKKLEGHIGMLVTEMLKKMPENVSAEAMEVCKMYPVQDMLLFLILGISMTDLFGEVRPFLSKHTGAAMAIITALDMKEINDYKWAIGPAIKFTLALLKPLNGAIFSRSPGKSFSIKGAVNLGLFFLKKKEKDKESKELMDLYKPIALFLLLGTFGSDKKERVALDKLKNKLQNFYRALYTFNVDEMIKDPAKLREHIQDTTKTLLNENSPL